MPIELWLLAVTLLLFVGLPLAVVWLDMARGYLGATGQLLAVTWLAGLLYLGATIFLEVDQQAQSLKCFNAPMSGAEVRSTKASAPLAG